MKLSVIIPTLDEGLYIGRLLKRILANLPENSEVIVVDGGSTDMTLSLVKSHGAKLIELSEASRAKQMNAGAQAAQGEVLYFVHADTMPPESFYADIEAALKGKIESGCFRFKFDSKKLILKINNFFAQFNWLIVRGGDQSLFIKKEVFEELGGYDDSMLIMEEYPLIEALMKRSTFRIIQKKILISDRKYCNRPWRRVLRANAAAFNMYKKGKDSKTIKEVYARILGSNKCST